MHWDDVRIFLAYASIGLFTHAAKRLGVRHSTVSRRIPMLEDELDTKLIKRRA